MPLFLLFYAPSRLHFAYHVQVDLATGISATSMHAVTLQADYRLTSEHVQTIREVVAYRGGLFSAMSVCGCMYVFVYQTIKAAFDYSSQLQTWFSTRFAARFSTSSCGFATRFRPAFNFFVKYLVANDIRQKVESWSKAFMVARYSQDIVKSSDENHEIENGCIPMHCGAL